MTTGHKRRESVGRITEGIEPNTQIHTIIHFIYQQLPKWRDDPEREPEQSECRLNSQLCKFLDSQARSCLPGFKFNHEEPQVANRSVDMSVTPVEKTVLGVRNYTKYEPVLVIECKRLPAPSADREKEYVIRAEPKKKSGGIQRFKLGLHAGQFDIAAMVGYVQKGTFQDRHYQINQWISKMAGHSTPDGCVWTAKERLNPIEEDMTNKTAKCSSVHKRSSNNEIVIHHLWIAMCS